MVERSLADLLSDLRPDRSARPWRLGDAESLVAAWADPEIARWNPVPPDASLETATAWIRGASTQTTASRSIDIVHVDAEDRIQGELGLQVDHDRGIAEIGFWVNAVDRRGGVGMRLIELAAHVAPFVGADRLFAVTSVANEAAIGLLHRAGWQEVATRNPSMSRAFTAVAAHDVRRDRPR